MGEASPTILQLEVNSAWVVILAVSIITLPVTLLLRRLIARPGGLASGLLLLAPLLLPLVAAIAFAEAVLPEITVLRPLARLLEEPTDLSNLMWVSDGTRATPYTFGGSAGTWLLLVGLTVSSFMLIRRGLGALGLARTIMRSRTLKPAELHVADSVAGLSARAGLRRPPDVLVLPDGISGAFASGVRRPRLLISAELIESLKPQELEGILAHEVAHLAARDVSVVLTAGILRDAIAWNPFAHIAFKRLKADRELEADRRACDLTKNPLALASGLLKVCELVRSGKRTRVHAVAAARSGSRISARVTNLLALHDGTAGAVSLGRLPYLFAAVLVSVLGLQAGAKLAAEEGGYAIVFGSPHQADASVWKAPSAPARMGTQQGHARGRTRYLPADGGILIVKTRDIPQWMEGISLTRAAKKLGLPPAALQWERQAAWQAVPLVSEPILRGVGIYRVQPFAR